MIVPSLIESMEAQLAVDTATAARIAEAAESLWAELAELGMVDAWDGPECVRVLPAGIAFMREAANRGPYLEGSL